MLKLTDSEKAIIKGIAKDIRFKTVEPLFNKILIESFGANVHPERFQGWRDFLYMFTDALKDKD